MKLMGCKSGATVKEAIVSLGLHGNNQLMAIARGRRDCNAGGTIGIETVLQEKKVAAWNPSLAARARCSIIVASVRGSLGWR